MEKGICKLCLQEKPLLRQSHIIPDFLYSLMYGVDHEIYKVPLIENRREVKVQTGEFEGNILCESCDNSIIGTYENYAKTLLFDGRPEVKTENQLHLDGKLVSTYCENVDYRKFKLFLLSILWRASVTTREFFKHIKLNPEQDNELREMILKGDPKEQLDYPCLISAFVGKKKKVSDQTITMPIKANDSFFVFPIGSFLYTFFPNDKWDIQALKEAAIDKTNILRIVHISDEQGEKLMKKLYGDKLYGKLIEDNLI